MGLEMALFRHDRPGRDYQSRWGPDRSSPTHPSTSKVGDWGWFENDQR